MALTAILFSKSLPNSLTLPQRVTVRKIEELEDRLTVQFCQWDLKTKFNPIAQPCFGMV